MPRWTAWPAPANRSAIPRGGYSAHDSLLGFELPFIIHWEGYHYVVVYGVSKRWVWVADLGPHGFARWPSKSSNADGAVPACSSPPAKAWRNWRWRARPGCVSSATWRHTKGFLCAPVPGDLCDPRCSGWCRP
ncbi:cysteine peptidase family C39 domain-containing protein [Cupriavidus basilensis]